MNRPIAFSEWWQVLQIAQTDDVTQIRRTYAALLKKTRPEDDPEAFQRLRTAYESAMAWASETEASHFVSTASAQAEHAEQPLVADPTTDGSAEAEMASRMAADERLARGRAAAGQETGGSVDIGLQASKAFDAWLENLPEDIDEYRVESMGELASGSDPRIIDSLTTMRMSATFVSLELADAFEYCALRYTALPDGLPTIRLALAEVYEWDHDIRAASRFGSQLAHEALWRVSADLQLAWFVSGRRGSPATSVLLDGKWPAALWKPIASDLLEDMRNTLKRLDGELSSLSDRVFDPELLNAWRKAVLRPRVTQGNIACIATLLVAVMAVGALVVSRDRNSLALAFFRDHEAIGLLLVVGGLGSIVAICGLTLAGVYLLGPEVAGVVRNFSGEWEARLGHRKLVTYGWYGVSSLAGAVAIAGAGTGMTHVATALSLAGAAWAILVNLPFILRNLPTLLEAMPFYMLATSLTWFGLTGDLDRMGFLNCAVLSFGTLRIQPVLREWMRDVYQPAQFWTLVSALGVGIAGWKLSPATDGGMPIWLLIGFWLWCAFVNVQLSLFFTGYLTHWIFIFVMWSIPGSMIVGASKVRPPEDVAVLAVMLYIGTTLVLELWRLWMLSLHGGRKPVL
ncbi:hypothetical protein [Pandoraea sp. NPDC090278]|uniref:hypothetical protein n=1 Tax=Pandoraea sp. NPDC090278 TaxID=3364391 RepID=UPI00383AD770